MTMPAQNCSRPARQSRAGAAGIDEAAHADGVTDLELLHAAADGRHAADDLVAGHGGILGEVPFVAGEVQVGVTYAAVENLDLDVGGRWRAALDGGGGEREEALAAAKALVE
jgi:hypothetical protein